jgi:hypothetical protein
MRCAHRNDAAECVDVEGRLFQVSWMKLRKRRECAEELAWDLQDLLFLGRESVRIRHVTLLSSWSDDRTQMCDGSTMYGPGGVLPGP